MSDDMNSDMGGMGGNRATKPASQASFQHARDDFRRSFIATAEETEAILEGAETSVDALNEAWAALGRKRGFCWTTVSALTLITAKRSRLLTFEADSERLYEIAQNSNLIESLTKTIFAMLWKVECYNGVTLAEVDQYRLGGLRDMGGRVETYERRAADIAKAALGEIDKYKRWQSPVIGGGQ